MSGWGVWRTEAGQDASQGQWFLDGGTHKPYVYATKSEAHSVMTGLQLLLPQNTYEVRPLPEPRVVLHLKTQDDQPCGSERRCCERCGIMIWGSQPNGPKWTDDRAIYASPPDPYISCETPHV